MPKPKRKQSQQEKYANPRQKPAKAEKKKKQIPLEKKEPGIASLVRMRANAIVPQSSDAETLLKRAGYVPIKGAVAVVYYRPDVAKRITTKTAKSQ